MPLAIVNTKRIPCRQLSLDKVFVDYITLVPNLHVSLSITVIWENSFCALVKGILIQTAITQLVVLKNCFTSIIHDTFSICIYQIFNTFIRSHLERIKNIYRTISGQQLQDQKRYRCSKNKSGKNQFRIIISIIIGRLELQIHH